MSIRKATILVTVLYDSSEPEGDRNYVHRNISDLSLADIEYAINEGECIGTHELVSNTEVPADKVQAELLAIGNDGDFFTDTDSATG